MSTYTDMIRAIATDQYRVNRAGEMLGELTAAELAIALAKGEEVTAKTVPIDNGTEEVPSVLLEPVPVTKDNLDAVIKAGHISKDAACKGVDKAAAPAACK